LARRGYRTRIRKVFVGVSKRLRGRMKTSFINKRIVPFLPIRWWHLMAAVSIFGFLVFLKMKKAGVPFKDIIKSAKPGA